MKTEANIVDWQRCKRDEAEQHRSRILTGSLGLEGLWTDWVEGRPDQIAMNREYEYRKRLMHFLILSKTRTNGIAYWWLPEGKGYTNDLERAGRFSDKESLAIVKGSDKDIRIPVPAVFELLTTRLIVDLGDSSNHTNVIQFDKA